MCWHCDRPLDARRGLNGEVPVKGAISLCIYCGAIGVFGTDLVLLPPTARLLNKLQADPEFSGTFLYFQYARQEAMLQHSLMRDRSDPDR